MKNDDDLLYKHVPTGMSNVHYRNLNRLFHQFQYYRSGMLVNTYSDLPKNKLIIDMTAIEEMEAKYPVIADEFKNIQAEQYELFSRKMLDYGPGNINMGSELVTDEEKRFSLHAVWIRMWDKMNRLKNLVILNTTSFIKDESIEDTYKDLGNYSIISLIVKRGKWKK